VADLLPVFLLLVLLLQVPMLTCANWAISVLGSC
jgi:hypothetical protein